MDNGREEAQELYLKIQELGELYNQSEVLKILNTDDFLFLGLDDFIEISRKIKIYNALGNSKDLSFASYMQRNSFNAFNDCWHKVMYKRCQNCEHYKVSRADNKTKEEYCNKNNQKIGLAHKKLDWCDKWWDLQFDKRRTR